MKKLSFLANKIILYFNYTPANHQTPTGRNGSLQQEIIRPKTCNCLLKYIQLSFQNDGMKFKLDAENSILT